MDQQGAIDSDPATKYGNNSTFVINISLSYAKARYYSEILSSLFRVGNLHLVPKRRSHIYKNRGTVVIQNHIQT